MPTLSFFEATFIGTVLEGLFYGLYCIIFVLYLRAHTSRKKADRNLMIYPLSTLFVLCTTYFCIDFSQQYLTIMRGQQNSPLVWSLNMTASALYSFVDFMGQTVLIYRCWVVWSRQLLVIIVPSILALTSLATALTLVGELHILGQTGNFDNPPEWFIPVGISSFSLSLAVNTTLTCLLVFKIAQASHALRESLARNTRGRSDLRLMSMLIESGVVLFMAQLIWVVLFALRNIGFYLVGGPITMLYGIVPTLIVVRVTMGYDSNTQASLIGNHMRPAFVDEDLTKVSGITSHSQFTPRSSIHPKDGK